MDLSPEQQLRYTTLATALAHEGVALRSDAQVCTDWIEHGAQAKIPALHDVVRLACESRFLHEYCNFPLGYSMAKGILKARGSKYPQKQWLEVIRRCVLLTSGEGRFPSIWPWQQNITPEAWKAFFDRTESICNPTVV